MRRAVFTFVMVFSLIASPLLANAQATPTTASIEWPAAETMLPDPSDFGSDWAKARSYSLPSNTAIFRDAAAAAYVGPSGSRKLVFIWQNRETRRALEQSWAEATDLFEYYRLAIDANTYLDSIVNAAPAPLGCQDSLRTSGDDLLAYLPAGATLCSLDFTLTVMAVVLGSWGELEQVEAADAVVQLVRTVNGL